MISKATAEVSKLGFAQSDSQEGWRPTQFWKLVQVLSSTNYAPFEDVRYHGLFKGDAKPLMAMERAGLISIQRENGIL